MMSNERCIMILLNIVFLYLLLQITPVSASIIEVYIYYFPGFNSSREIEDYFSRHPELKLTFNYLNDSDNLKKFLGIVDLLVAQGFSLLPSDFCTRCEMVREAKEIYVRYSTPLALIFQDGRLTAIVVLKNNENMLEQALTYSGNMTKIFLADGKTELLRDDVRIRLEELLKNGMKPRIIISYFLPAIITAAFLDAVNPCEFLSLIIFLSLVAMRFGREAVLRFGMAFSIAIFITYFMMGFGIWRLIGYIYETKLFVVILGFSIGLRSILRFLFSFFSLSIGFREATGSLLNKRFKRIPKSILEKIAKYLRRFSNKPLSAFLLGVILSVFLLPCTSGPYLIALSLIADLETQEYGLILLTLYNSIVVAPFVIITAGIYLLKIKSSHLKIWFSTRQKWLNLMSGLLMLALSIYLIFYAS